MGCDWERQRDHGPGMPGPYGKALPGFARLAGWGPAPQRRLMTGRGWCARQRLRLAEFGPVESVKRDQGEAEHGHDETARHIELVRYITHQFRQDGAAHDRHHDVRGGFLGARAEAENPQRENRREHDGHEEIAYGTGVGLGATAPTPIFGAFEQYQSSGISNYNGLTASISRSEERRVGKDGGPRGTP